VKTGFAENNGVCVKSVSKSAEKDFEKGWQWETNQWKGGLVWHWWGNNKVTHEGRF